jgi:hypothetical protein
MRRFISMTSFRKRRDRSRFWHVFGAQIAILERLHIVFHAAEVEEQLLLRCGGADFDQAPAAQDEFLHRRLDPPHRIGREAEAAIGIEFLHALHQADIAFGNQLAETGRP